MNVKKLSPVAEYLRANHAKAAEHESYRAITGEFVKSCKFFDPNGRYLGKMSRVVPEYGKTIAYARLQSYIETMESGYRAGFRQVKENVINFAKFLGLNGKKECYLPEKMVKKQIVINNQGYKTEDIFERKIDSKLTLVKKAEKNVYGYVPQNIYKAEEPVTYKEVQTGHNVTKSDKF